ncbi:hypothetical protein GCM10011503_10390 [Henriciella pelagia]|uniref:Uncharacterized protein n=2 Tax=Hyphomonadaceae TaxID=69657 RepID=A0ABQ1JCI4_9PROT|nr:hypothetical protein GCM10011503_10390 [Henriciella pelagia]
MDRFHPGCVAWATFIDSKGTHMKFGIDHLLAGMAIAAAGGGVLSLSAWSSPNTNPMETRFTEADYAAFDRNFTYGDQTCEVGFADHGLCFSSSSLENNIVKGERFPDTMYPLALEWRASLNMPRKPDALKTVRIGRTIALMDRESRTVIDTMRLDRTSFAEATQATSG